MTFTRKNSSWGFTLIESIVSMAIVAAGTMAIIASLKYGDQTALRARLDARGGKEFAKQAQWIIAYPSDQFRSGLPLGVTASNYSEVASTNGAGGKFLIPQPGKFLLMDSSVDPSTGERGGFRYWTEMRVQVPADPGDGSLSEPYTIRLATYWEVPGGQGVNDPALKTNVMEMSGIRKW
jgi:prepilin-type N-terminal cleavage/methylation domain-containing protein